MNDVTVVFAILGAAAILFASGKARLDVVALLVVLALSLTGVLSVGEALAGFGDPVVILVIGLLIVGEGLQRTGVATVIGRWIVDKGGQSETRLVSLLMLVAAGLGSVMSSTAVVAILIPVVQNISRKTSLNPSRLLMPMAFGALISGMLTLIATTPNLVVSESLGNAGYVSFNFFSFTPIGVAILVVAVGYILLIGRRLLPGDRTLPPTTPSLSIVEMMTEFGVAGQARRALIKPGSPLAGVALSGAGLGAEHGLRVIMVERVGRLGTVLTVTPGAGFVLRTGDVMVLQDRADGLAAACDQFMLEAQDVSDRHRAQWVRELGMAAVMVSQESVLVGRSLRDAGFRGRFGMQVLAVKRRGEVLDNFQDDPLRVGDSLLVVGSWRKITRLQNDAHDLVLFATPAEIRDVAPEVKKLPTALVILGAMVALSALELTPVVLAVLMAALAMVGVRILTMEDSYRAVHWSSIVLIAGMLPIAAALEKTGGTALIVDGLVKGLGDISPYAMLSVIFAITAGMGLVLSNTATAVLMAPIAIKLAESLDVSPYAFAMTVAIAASAAFMTPVSTPVVTLVVEPGKYRFVDFLKVGTPLVLLTGVVTVLLAPVIFPF